MLDKFVLRAYNQKLRKKLFTYNMGTSKENSGLLLPLKLISKSLQTDSKNSTVIRHGIIKMLEDKMDEVTCIPTDEVPKIRKLLTTISPTEPKVAEEVNQLIEKFHPNL